MTCTIISFYADRETNKNVDTDTSTYYSDHAKRLTEELKKIDIPHDIRELKSQNNYMKNCLMKPGFILSMLEEKKSPVCSSLALRSSSITRFTSSLNDCCWACA